MKILQGDDNLRTTKTPTFLTKNSIGINKSKPFKKRVTEKEEPSNLVEDILYNMKRLHSMMSKNSTMVFKKPGYQNYIEV